MVAAVACFEIKNIGWIIGDLLLCPYATTNTVIELVFNSISGIGAIVIRIAIII